MIDARQALTRAAALLVEWGRHGPGAVVYTLVGSVLALVFFRPIADDFTTKLVSGHVDIYFVLWGVDWVQRQCFGLCGPLFDTNVYVPHRFSLLHADSMIGQALLTLPLRWVGAGPATIFNTLQVAALAACAVAMALLAAELTGHRWSALVALVIFGFFPSRAALVTNALSQYSFGLPLMLWALVVWTRRGATWSIWACGAAFVLQAWFSMQMALWTALGFALCAPWILLGDRAWRTRRQLRQLGLAVVVSVVVLAPLALGYLRMGHDLGFARSLRETVAYSGSTDALKEARLAFEHDPWIRGDPAKGAGHLGLLPCLLAGLGVLALLWRRIRGDRREPWQALLPGLLLILVGLVVYIGPIDKSDGEQRALFWYLREWIPGLKGVRVPDRGIMLTYVGLGLLAAEGARGLFAWTRLSGVRALGAVLAATAVFWYWMPRPQIVATPATISDAAAVMRELPAGAVPLPWPSFRNYHDGAARDYEATAHDKRIVGGYTGIFTWMYRQLYLELDQLPAGRSLEVAGALGATHWVVDSRRLDGKRSEALTAALDDARLQGPVVERGPFRAYTLTRREPRQLGLSELLARAPLSVVAGAQVEAGSFATTAFALPDVLTSGPRVNPTQTWQGEVELRCAAGDSDERAVVAAPPIVDSEHRLLSVSFRATTQPGRCELALTVDGDPLGRGSIDVVAPSVDKPRAVVEIVDAPASTWADCGTRVQLRLRNTGGRVLRARSDVGWPPFQGEFQIECRFDGASSETTRVVAEWGDGALYADLAPGAGAERVLRLRAPRRAGRYTLRCRPVLAYTGFIGDFGAPHELTVLP